MNNIEEAAKLLENGWCVGELLEKDENDKDAHCAVGAVAAVMGIMEFIEVDEGNDVVDDLATYKNFRATPEAKALADEVIASEWFSDQSLDNFTKTLVQDAFGREDWDEVVFNFNDSQETAQPVIEMFKHAAKRLD